MHAEASAMHPPEGLGGGGSAQPHARAMRLLPLNGHPSSSDLPPASSVLLGDVVEHSPLAGLLELTGDDDLIEDVVSLVEVEDKVELAHIAKVAIQTLDEVVNRLEREKLVVVRLDASDEVEAGVALVANLVVTPLEEVADLRWAAQDKAANLPDGAELVTLQARHKPLLQPSLALAADEQNVLDHLGAVVSIRGRAFFLGELRSQSTEANPDGLAKMADLWRAAQDKAAYLLDGAELVALQARHEPLLQPSLALA
eukprot:CAMPEP_0115598430 /NCGR_PEP_ID=MMETSP0272-20121206/13872_1 /TAXON_ID=71861 /ORGANISM="Scrippsiella trochoidea, Strain CCMP3099" /LENGTH=255 /DNA_ID=CAMNT_0003033849 /DNA_START=111 /DNA_END=876 /DNA_ORIENTATION=-